MDTQYFKGLLSRFQRDPSGLSFDEIRQLRDFLGDDHVAQEALAPWEHRAFALEYSKDSPMRSLGLFAAIPVYQLAKSAGLLRGRSGESNPVAQMSMGYQGLMQGLVGR